MLEKIAPVEGTILTVLRDWARHVADRAQEIKDFGVLLPESLKAAKVSLENTPKQMQVLESHPEPASAMRAREPEMALEGAAAGPAPMAVAAQPMRAGAVDPNDPSTWRNAGRNALCPCGSGRKYKHCHGKFGA